MGNKLVVGPIKKGLSTFYLPFNIDNDSFPKIINAHQFRGRIRRKRGTAKLCRLMRFFDSTSTAYTSTSTITLDGSGTGNILTGFSLETNGNIVPGTVTITTVPGGVVYTDPTMDGTLSPSGTINYATGEIIIAAEANNSISVVLRYYPSLPVMGLEDRDLNPTEEPGTIGFDTTYAYDISTSEPYNAHDISFYKNPAASAALPGYLQKTVWTPVRWHGLTYQQFWTVNYAGAFWATNGIQVPFVSSNVGLQIKQIVAVTVLTPTTANIQINTHNLVIGDFLFINEVVTTTGINLQTGYVTALAGANNVIVTFPNANLVGNGTGGIAQYLTNTADPAVDCIRWYDGDPTNGSDTAPVFGTGKGWVNFMPPLSLNDFSVVRLPPAKYYLVTARAIVPYKDRLLFIGPVVQTSAAGATPIYLQDAVIYSQNGTPYYTASWNNATGDPRISTTVFTPILVPINQTATPLSFIEDSPGYGGNVFAGLSQAINSISINEDVLIIGLKNTQTRLTFTGSDLDPFVFYFINSEYGSSSFFSAINLDKGVITKGDRSYTFTSQVAAERIDLEIPDQVFQVNLTSNGNERFCSQRDFEEEYIYFTYPSNDFPSTYPNQSLQYNYREQSWSINNETYTTYGQFKRKTGYTWNTVGNIYPTWNDWTVPWDSGEATVQQPELIAGNQQGFVVFRDEGIGEAPSLAIQAFSGNTITVIDHTLNDGDFVYIQNTTGTIATQVNNKIFQVKLLSPEDPDRFKLLSDPIVTAGTYFGNGTITRLYRPYIQSKQFPVAWELGRKTRIGVQQYLLTTTARGQITLLLFLSQNGSESYNEGSVYPNIRDLINNSLIYSTVLFTCPESTNLGLTPANVNLQMPTAVQQSQTWHRINTSLIGDTIQVGFTLSDDQMDTVDEEGNFIAQDQEIEIHGFILDVTSSQMLS